MKFLTNANLTGNEFENVKRIQFTTSSGGQASQPGALYWAPEDKTLSLGTINGSSIEIGQENVLPIMNQTGALIPDGAVVGYDGALGASGIIKGKLYTANGVEPAEFLLGIATHDIPNGEIGHVATFGKLRGLNTTGTPYGETWVAGDILWAHPTVPGGLTKVKPTAPNLKINMAAVTSVHATQGSIVIRATYGSYLGDNHNSHIANLANNDILVYNSGNSRWENVPITAHTHTFASLTSKPTTLSGYGITDAAPSSHVGSTGAAHGVATTSVNGFMSSADKSKLDGIATNANNYAHPANHLPAIITQDANNRFVTDAEKATWNAKASGSHAHDATDITSGTLSTSRVPNLDMGKITTGSLESTRIHEPSYVIAGVTRTARSLFDVLRADRGAFLPASQIIIEKSIDAGVTWENANITDDTKARLFTGQRPSIPLPLKDGVKNTDCMIRITITGMRYNVPGGTPETEKYNFWSSTYVQSTERYFALNEGWVWMSSNSDRIHCRVERATGANPTSWLLDREAFMAGWSGGNYISLSGNTFGGGTTQTGNTWNWRFTFRTATTSNDFDNAKLSLTYPSTAQVINHIKLGGINVWTSANNLMYNDHLYSWDVGMNATFPAELKATTFKNLQGVEVSYSNHDHGTVYEPKNSNIQGHISSTSNPHSVTKAQVNLGNVQNYGLSTQLEAETGAIDTAYMTPLKTKQAIDSLQAVKSVAGKTGTVTLGPSDVGAMASNHDASAVTSSKITNWDAAYTHSISAHLALGTTSTTAFRGDYGNTAYTHSQAAHAPSNAQANQTLTSGNGMEAWTATSGNLTIAMGTPSTLTTSTTNSLTATSHAHEVTFPVTSVNTKTGAVSLTASDVGAAAVTHTHVLADITNAGNLAAINTNASTSNYLRGDGTWVTPPDTTYSEISEAEITAGTASTLRTITARRLKFVQDNTERYHVGTTPPSNTKLLWIDTN